MSLSGPQNGKCKHSCGLEARSWRRGKIMPSTADCGACLALSNTCARPVPASDSDLQQSARYVSATLG